MTWAVSQKCGSAGQKLVLLMLANHCNGHTGQCNPSHSRLAAECSMSVSALKVHLSRLGQDGLIEIVHNTRDGVSLPNSYRLGMAAIVSGGVGQNLAGGGSESDRGVGQNLATNQEFEPGIEPTDNANARGEPPLPPCHGAAMTPDSKAGVQAKTIENLFAFLNSRAGTEYRARTPNGHALSANGRALAALLRHGYTPDDVRAVIARKARDWGKDPKMAQYLRPNTLFRPSNFESYLGQCVVAV